MRKEQFYYESELYERCTLTKARQAYNAGQTVILAPINAAMFHGPNSLWIPVNKDFYSCEDRTFKQVINSFEYYNLHQGAGNYTKYFIKR
jgi:hypothetical protein